MPIKINNNLPAAKKLNTEGVFIMTPERANTQDIRPLKIGILNLMPTKEATEVQLLRLLGNSPLQVDVTLLHPASHIGKKAPVDHLATYYKTFDDIKDERFDGFIITGAPVETKPFEEVYYWEELTKIMEWTRQNVFSTLHICWGAQAGLYYHYGVPKYNLDKKLFGVFKHTISAHSMLFNGFDPTFMAPHSRNSTVYREDILAVPSLSLFSESDEAGVFIAASRKGRQVFVTGHIEYDVDTLKKEYERDAAKGLDNVDIPKNYYRNDDPTQPPMMTWRAHANLLFVNWLNYYVYQKTPFDLSELAEENE